jgi:hypothetical protein
MAYCTQGGICVAACLRRRAMHHSAAGSLAAHTPLCEIDTPYTYSGDQPGRGVYVLVPGREGRKKTEPTMKRTPPLCGRYTRQKPPHNHTKIIIGCCYPFNTVTPESRWQPRGTRRISQGFGAPKVQDRDAELSASVPHDTQYTPPPLPVRCPTGPGIPKKS